MNRANPIAIFLLVIGCQRGAGDPTPPGPSSGNSGGRDAGRPPPGTIGGGETTPDPVVVAVDARGGSDAAVDADGTTTGGTGSIDSGGTSDRPPAGPVTTVPLTRIIPRAASTTETAGAFRLGPSTGIFVEPATPEMMSVAQFLADRLRPATGYPLAVTPATGPPAAGNIHLVAGGSVGLGDEGYDLRIGEGGLTLASDRPAGIFFGVQTIRQLLPAAIEQKTVQPGPWALATGTIRDRPRFAWRGAMLDMARYFFGVDVVKRYIDLFSYYKINRLHLHLTDDQGWRLAIDAWPRLTSHGGTTQVGGGPGGSYTKAEYIDLVAYAQRRYVVIVPEIDMPGHTNAALSSYPELNCNGVAPPLYTGIGVGFSGLCVGSPSTDRFVREVLGEIAAMTPGPYLHIGGDETMATSAADYARFINSAEAVVKSLGKRMIGWDEVVKTDNLDPTSIAQHWQDATLPARAKQRGAKIILSPASRAYLNMKYDAATPMGADWAGYNDEQHAYDWDPVTVVPGLLEDDVLGLEAPLWTLVLRSIPDMDYLAFPRLAGLAEIGWSPRAGRTWDEYKIRIASHGPRLTAMGVNFYKSTRIPWP